jgi:Pyruvate/2-oxoacid:ferredoxin oxidoreductase delta subunit
LLSFRSSQFFQLNKKTSFQVPVPILTPDLVINGNYFGSKLLAFGDFPRRVSIGEILFKDDKNKILSPVNGIISKEGEENSVHLRIDGELNYRAKFEKKEFTYLELKNKLEALAIVSLDFPNLRLIDQLDLFNASEDSIVIYAPYTKENFLDYHGKILEHNKPEFDALKQNLGKIFSKSKTLDFMSTEKLEYSYPDGSPRYFLYKHCDMNIHGEFPFEKILYLGPETIYYLIQALYFNVPFQERFLSVTIINRKGLLEGDTKVYRVKNGTNLFEFLQMIRDTYKYKYYTINSFYDKQPVYEIGSDFIFDIYRHHALIICEEMYRESEEDSCIECNDCSYFCPVSANPRVLLENNKSSFRKDICLECGLCSVFCPSHIDFSVKISEFNKEIPFAISQGFSNK